MATGAETGAGVQPNRFGHQYLGLHNAMDSALVSNLRDLKFRIHLAKNFKEAQGYYIPGSEVCTSCNGWGEYDSMYHDDRNIVKCIECGGSGHK